MTFFFDCIDIKLNNNLIYYSDVDLIVEIDQ